MAISSRSLNNLCELGIVLCAFFSGTICGRLDFLHLPAHDGVSRTCRLVAENYTRVLSEDQKTTVVLFESSGTSGKCYDGPVCEAEVLSQTLSNSGIRVCLAAAEMRTDKVEEVLIYKNGRKLPYYGRKTATAILSFLVKVDSSQVRVITGKLDKIAFDAVQEPKLVGLFMNGTPDFLAYQEASRLFTPTVHFYAVFDRTVAKHLRLDVVGDIYLYKPMHKSPVACPINPATVADLQAFIQAQHGALLTKLTENNVNDPMIEDPKRVNILAIAEQTSPMGGYLHKLLTKTIRNNTNNTEFNRLTVLWVEPDLFPYVYLTPLLQATEMSQPPCLGSVDGAASVWFDMTQLNSTAEKTADEQNVALLNQWLLSVIAKEVPASGAPQSFLVQPSSLTVSEGSDFILECKVQNPVGDCLWLHNGQNLGFNMNRYDGLYSWVVSRDDPIASAGDCSLRVTGAQTRRQDGQWVCEMTGNSDSPTITSPPARIVIAPKDTKTEL